MRLLRKAKRSSITFLTLCKKKRLMCFKQVLACASDERCKHTALKYARQFNLSVAENCFKKPIKNQNPVKANWVHRPEHSKLCPVRRLALCPFPVLYCTCVYTTRVADFDDQFPLVPRDLRLPLGIKANESARLMPVFARSRSRKKCPAEIS